ncbi:MAG: hypothetical protein IKW77_05120 [Salinivirgaceae bacterium]|nr:hypothetical protein [Salinivirgaceae bacterium]
MSRDLYQNRFLIPSARAAWHDYNGGLYFITICTSGREHYFGEIADGQMHLSEIGTFTDESIRKMESLHNDVRVPLYVVMPNHIHLIMIMEPTATTTPTDANVETSNVETPTVETPYYDVSTKNNVSTNGNDVSTINNDSANAAPRNETMQKIANQCGRVSHIISRFKTAVTKYANDNGLVFGWQPRFHDHIVRNQNEINGIAEYIENNVANWETDCYRYQSDETEISNT